MVDSAIVESYNAILPSCQYLCVRKCVRVCGVVNEKQTAVIRLILIIFMRSIYIYTMFIRQII